MINKLQNMKYVMRCICIRLPLAATTLPWLVKVVVVVIIVVYTISPFVNCEVVNNYYLLSWGGMTGNNLHFLEATS